MFYDMFVPCLKCIYKVFVDEFDFIILSGIYVLRNLLKKVQNG